MGPRPHAFMAQWQPGAWAAKLRKTWSERHVSWARAGCSCCTHGLSPWRSVGHVHWPPAACVAHLSRCSRPGSFFQFQQVGALGARVGAPEGGHRGRMRGPDRLVEFGVALGLQSFMQHLCMVVAHSHLIICHVSPVGVALRFRFALASQPSHKLSVHSALRRATAQLLC